MQKSKFSPICAEGTSYSSVQLQNVLNLVQELGFTKSWRFIPPNASIFKEFQWIEVVTRKHISVVVFNSEFGGGFTISSLHFPLLE